MIYRNECPRGFLSHFSSDLMDEGPLARPGLKSRPLQVDKAALGRAAHVRICPIVWRRHGEGKREGE